MKSFFDKKPLVAPVDLVFIIKSNVGWFLLKRVDLVIVAFLHIIGRNHSNTLFFINLQKPKTIAIID